MTGQVDPSCRVTFADGSVRGFVYGRFVVLADGLLAVEVDDATVVVYASGAWACAEQVSESPAAAGLRVAVGVS
jgi:hypothetical protein